MLYLGIDQHARQLTISLRNENGDVVQARQVSTRPEKIQAFFTKLTCQTNVAVGQMVKNIQHPAAKPGLCSSAT